LEPICGEAGDKIKGAGGVLSMLSSTELGLDTSSISTSRKGEHMIVIGIGVLIVPSSYKCQVMHSRHTFYGDTNRSNLSFGHQKWRQGIAGKE
jgi:hypothetical protein